MNAPMHAAPARRMTPRQWGLLGLLSLPWGGSFLFYRILAAELPPFTVVLGRFGFCALVLVPVLLAARRPWRPVLAAWPAVLLVALLNGAAPYTLFAAASGRLGAGLEAILNATTPLWGVLVAQALGVERLTVRRGLGVIGGFIGVAIVVGPQGSGAGGWREALAVAEALAAPLLYGLGAVFSMRLRHLDPLANATGLALGAVLILAPCAALLEQPWALASPSLAGWASLVGIGVISTACANLIYFALLAGAGASNLLLVTFLVPITAVLLGHFVLGEVLAARALLGMLVVFAALAVIDGRVLRLLPGPAR